jgi:hypothetical protein
MIALLAVSVWCAVVMAGGGGGRLAFHARTDTGMTAAPWMDWANPVVDLAAAAPAYVPVAGAPAAAARANAAQAGLLATLPWLVCVGGALAFTVWFVDRRTRSTEAAVAVCTIACSAAAMIAATIVWLTRDSSPIAIVPAEMQALRASAAPRAMTIDLTGRPRFGRVDVYAMSIDVPIRRAGRGGFRVPNRPLAAFPQPPAGLYAMSVKRHGAADGWIMAGVGNDQYSIVTKPMTDADAGVRIELPVDVSTLSVRAEEAGRDQLDAVVLRPLSIGLRTSSPGVARRAVRYGETNAFFMDDSAYPEPGGFWVGGGRTATVAIAPARPEPVLSLWLRNGPIANAVAVDCGSWRVDLSLAAGEERRVDVPMRDRQISARLRIRSAETFRPSAIDPNSRDTRLLGVFVRF